ncbi:MAG: hypothetical protein H7039_10355 [Bryobacteraceae bacterium]|nr:hypothetical protein [Bryobacteraceae bacterium]
MTYVAAIIVPEGIVALADTRITVGNEKLYNEKYWNCDDSSKGHYFALFSGNRSWTEEVIQFLDREVDWSRAGTVAELSSEVGKYFWRLRDTYRNTLSAGVDFDIGLIIGGRGRNDIRQDLRFVYQAGNHVTYSDFTPYFASGQSMYGKFILEDGVFYRSFQTGEVNDVQGTPTSLQEAIGAVLLSFHATQTSVTTVDYPVHLLAYPATTGRIHRFFLRSSDLREFRDHWRRSLIEFLHTASLPDEVRELMADAEKLRNDHSHLTKA